MTVEHLAECSVQEGAVQKLEFCDQHNEALNMLVLERQMTDGERSSVVDTMLFGVVSFMGPNPFDQHKGCPVCVLEGTLERACDEIAMIRRKSN